MVKVERSQPAPASLAEEARKADGACNGKDVIERLASDFNDKCYICELKGLQDPNVEHLLPHEQGKRHDLKFDWDNLFWSCSHCNQVKNKSRYAAGIIDCCKRDPETAIHFGMKGSELDIRPIQLDDEAKRTAELVFEVFNTRKTGMRTQASSHRMRELQKEMNVLFTELQTYGENERSAWTKMRLSALLRRESAFAAFKRCYVRQHLNEYPALAEYVA
ncbi:MAG TPA: hypothetical protein H9823_04310 [Candidatus Rubneribacter avistercoris]|nr:hypothetical protein [Candidatus Rubneribacter avistercoris]